MTKQDFILNIFRYYSRFVPKSVLNDLFSQPPVSRSSGYDELVAEMIAQDDNHVIAGIGAFIVSSNDSFVRDSVRNAKGITLFIEYGAFSYDSTVTDGVTEKMGISICHEYNMSNNDNLQEALLMNDCNNILNEILEQMQTDQTELEACALKLIMFPAIIHPIVPELFEGRIGWTALFDNENSVG